MSYMPGLVECRSDQGLTGLGDKMHDETLKQGKKVKKTRGMGKGKLWFSFRDDLLLLSRHSGVVVLVSVLYLTLARNRHEPPLHCAWMLPLIAP